MTLSAKWKHAEHINALECRAVLLALRWRARQPLRHSGRFLHLVDSRVTMGAIGKGRSGSRSLRHVLRQVASTCLAANLVPVLGFTRSHTNPADKPSRRGRTSGHSSAASLTTKRVRTLRRD